MQYYTGLKLYQVAKRRAVEMGMYSISTKMEHLIHEIQKREGNTPCFRRKETCSEAGCIWQGGCAAKMDVAMQ